MAIKAPLLEGWCAPDSHLSEIGQQLGRRVLRYTEKKNCPSSPPSTPLLKMFATTPDVTYVAHFHARRALRGRSSTWPRPLTRSVRERIMKSWELSMQFVKNFTRIARINFRGRGIGVSFEWPRHCSGRQQPEVRDMLDKLNLIFVDIDGCSVVVTRQSDGALILKPWRFAVSSPQLAEQLSSFCCRGGHHHAFCSGATRSAFYPADLCKAMHRGLDANEERHRHGAALAQAMPSGAEQVVPMPPSGEGGNQPRAIEIQSRHGFGLRGNQPHATELHQSRHEFGLQERCDDGVEHDVCRSHPGVAHDICRSDPGEPTGPAATPGGCAQKGDPSVLLLLLLSSPPPGCRR